MLFSSLVFLFFFLPLILTTYYLSPRRIKNFILLLFSLIFYAWGGVSYTLVLILSIIINYLFVRQIEKNSIQKKKILAVGLSFNILFLFIFKYLNFFVENINVLGSSLSNTFTEFAEPKIVLPLGISFFTFQQISLLIDVYRDPKVKNINFLDTALYIGFFPQLIAGPIVRYNDIISQIRSRKETIKLVSSGVRKFISGLFKKVVIADTCAAITDSILDYDISEISTATAWLGITAYAFQIYFDFSGYSDMAIGLGRMFGFRILENFNFPYISKSIKEFWRRWHISLSSWFRDYLYIPLGGNRMGSYKTYFNLTIVFFLTGFWHGANWSFIFWGLFHGLFLIIERLGFDKILKRLPKVISWTYTMLIVLIAWVFFRLESLPHSFSFIAKLFGCGTPGEMNHIDFLNNERNFILILATIYSSSIFSKLKDIHSFFLRKKINFILIVVRDIFILLLFICSIAYINSGSYSPFIYFRF